MAARPRGGRDDDPKQAARPAARRHDGAEHHRAEPHQQGVDERQGVEVEALWVAKLLPASVGDKEAQPLTQIGEGGRPIGATENESPQTRDAEGRGAAMGTNGGS